MRTLRWLLTLGFLGTALWMADVSGQIRPVPGSGDVSNATGTLAVTHGGTALTTITAHNALIGTGTSAITVVPGGTNCALFWTTSSSDPTCSTTVAIGAAGGYKIARGSTQLDGTNPTTVPTGLTSVVACTGTLLRATALNTGTAFVTHDTPSGANVDFYGWVVAGTASSGTEFFDWTCTGT